VSELMVRMAELAASQDAGDVLTALGLGSCVGVALLDGSGAVAALAHVVLPDSHEAVDAGAATPAKFADTAVPMLVEEMLRNGARRTGLYAVLVGGAQMFSLGAASMDIGRRNEAGVRQALDAAGVPVRTAVTGGGVGRTLRVYVGSGKVTCKEAGGTETDVFTITSGELAEAA
jgi:chemotaxis protein CheD